VFAVDDGLAAGGASETKDITPLASYAGTRFGLEVKEAAGWKNTAYRGNWKDRSVGGCTGYWPDIPARASVDLRPFQKSGSCSRPNYCALATFLRRKMPASCTEIRASRGSGILKDAAWSSLTLQKCVKANLPSGGGVKSKLVSINTNRRGSLEDLEKITRRSRERQEHNHANAKFPPPRNELCDPV